MPSRHKSGFPTKVLTHLDVENQVTFDLLITYRYFIDWSFPNLNGSTHIFHHLQDCIPPEGVAIFSIELASLGDGLRNFYSEFINANPIFGFDFANDPVSLP